MSDNVIRVIHAGRVGYGEMLDRQHRLFDGLVAEKRAGRPVSAEYIITVEHDPVITLGRHADRANLLVSKTALDARGVALASIDRGGDITYHGPGQLVVYPIIDMERHGLGVKAYVNILEQAVIDLLDELGIAAGRVEGATGVWLGTGTPAERKICAIGVRCSHFVTMHGLALNVSTDLTQFGLINPCGFTDKGVTSVARELPGTAYTPGILAPRIANHLLGLLNRGRGAEPGASVK